MSDTVISVEGLGKRYRIGANRERYVALRDVVANGTRALGRRFVGRGPDRPSYEEFWALKDVYDRTVSNACTAVLTSYPHSRKCPSSGAEVAASSSTIST